MNIKSIILLTALTIISIHAMFAQSRQIPDPVIPFNTSRTEIFGDDIFINDQPGQNQRNLAVCSAFNGWLYASFGYFKQNKQWIDFYRSTDNGKTWNIFLTSQYLPTIIKIELVTSGNTLENLKLFTGIVYKDTVSGHCYVDLMVHNGVTGEGIASFWVDSYQIHDLALSSDYLFPAASSSPNSIAFLYTKTEYDLDYLVFCSSSDGGLSIDNTYTVATSQKYLGKVDLSYGYSLSYNSGRYFAVWEEKEGPDSELGHIYTSHSDPNFNSPFTIPVCIDSLDASAINQCRNPVVACQYSDADNDSANITQVVLFEKFNSSYQKYGVSGGYNLRAASNKHFKMLNVSASGNNELQPDIAFNPYDSTFMATYFNSTTLKLPFVTKNFNMVNPGSWTIVSPGYNDNPNLAVPNPRVALNFEKRVGATVWSAERPGGNGASMFDAVYIYYTGTPGNDQTDSYGLFRVYPNPCSNQVTITFELKKTGKVTIELFNLIGQPIEIITDQTYPAGRYELKRDVTNLPAGNYLCTFKTDDFSSCGRILVIR